MPIDSHRLRNIKNSISRYRSLLIGIALTAALIVSVKNAWQSPATYAVAQILPAAYNNGVAHQNIYQAQSDILLSPRLASKVISRLHLMEVAEFQNQTNGDKKWIDALLRPKRITPTANPEAIAARTYARKLQINTSSSSPLILVKFYSPDPILAAAVANAHASEYLAYTDGLIWARSIKKQAELADMLDQLEILRKELTVVEQRLQRLLHDEANRDAPESLPGPADSSPALNEVRDQLLFAEAAYYAVYRDQDTLHSDLEAVTWVVNDPAVEEQLREKNRAEEHFEYLSVVNGRLHWGTIAAAEELEAAQTLMDQRIQMAAEQIRKNYQSLLAVEGKMSGVSENTGKTYSPQTVSELSIFQREVNSKRKRYYQFYDTVNTAMKSIHSGAVHARIIKRAQP